MKVLITGAAGFIGYHLTARLLREGTEVVGLDVINDYYDPRLKIARLAEMGIPTDTVTYGKASQSTRYAGYKFMKLNLCDRDGIDDLFSKEGFTHVCNLAGQAGVRYSIDNPHAYVASNVVGFLHILEACRHFGVRHLAYASSSSIYGECDHVPFREDDDTDHPVSLYAATKKSNELMAHAYSQLYGIQTTGMRFFTVYGPWGRPDMAPFKFMKAMLEDREIQVYNHGNMWRDFTYIDDIINGVIPILHADDHRAVPFRVYNIGCSHPVKLMDFIHTIETVTGHAAKMKMMEMQPGDVRALTQTPPGYKQTSDIVLRPHLPKALPGYMTGTDVSIFSMMGNLLPLITHLAQQVLLMGCQVLGQLHVISDD